MANKKKAITEKQEIAKIKHQLKQVIKAYLILEQYTCELVDDSEENETLTECNEIFEKAIKHK